MSFLPPRLRVGRVAAAFAMSAAVLSSCGLIGARPPVRPIPVSAFVGAFPMLQRLAVRGYLSDTDCELLDYGRGFFVSDVTSAYCGFLDGQPPPRRQPFDAAARGDLATVEAAFASEGVAVN